MPAMPQPNTPKVTLTNKGEESAAQWVKGILDGSGSGPDQMIIGVVIGCIPFVGQAVDIGNIIVAIIDITENPENNEGWFNLIIGFVAFIPIFGDALKIVFKQLRKKQAIGRILDSIPQKKLRGDIEKWLRNLDWNSYADEIIGYVNDIISKLIDLMESWVVKAVAGNKQAHTLVQQLEKMQRMVQDKITTCMQELQQSHQAALAMGLPNTTALTMQNAQRGVKNNKPLPQAGTQKTTPAGNTGGNQASPSQKNNHQQRQSVVGRTNYRAGVLGEHITDYYYHKIKKLREKINYHGKLYECNTKGHQGIDHIWLMKDGSYCISDSKATKYPISPAIDAKMAATIASTPDEIFYLTGLATNDKMTGNIVGTTKSDGRQMSHKWIAIKIRTANLAGLHNTKLGRLIQDWAEDEFEGNCPYDRSLIMINGSTLNKHDHHGSTKNQKKQNVVHDDCPCKKPPTTHQVNKEFVLAPDLLKE